MNGSRFLFVVVWCNARNVPLKYIDQNLDLEKTHEYDFLNIL